jgi:thymidine phosphorylase
MIRETFKNGTALKKFHDMIIGQGVEKNIAEQLISDDEIKVNEILKLANVQHRAIALQNGFIQSIDSFKLGTIVQRLGMLKISIGNKIA